MKVFLAGSTGALGRRLVPLLAARGHDVVAMTRSPANRDLLRHLGAEPVVADGLDRDAVIAAVARAEPHAVVHEMTALAGVTSVKHFDDEFALTNRLRTEGVDILLDAARVAGTRRFVAQSFGNWNYERTGSEPKSEEDPLDPDPPAAMARSLDAIRHLESAVLGDLAIEGIVLRYANLYGPGALIGADGAMVEDVLRRRVPIIGDGAGVWSFVHLDDAARATARALEVAAPGVYNVADDEPAPVSVWLPELASVLEAKPPRRVPVWLGRIAAGDAGVSLFTQIRGASNAKAKCELGWRPRYASWREGFRFGLAAGPAGAYAAARAA
jgi:nucleoside-diphosphate-sugar epimerase